MNYFSISHSGKKNVGYGLIVLILVWGILPNRAVSQTHNGHSHNDYEHPNPLFGAIENGFRSLEIDIWLKNDQLIVSHLPLLLGWKPTLAEQYLAPLKAHIDKNDGFVFPGDSTPLILYLDFKTGAGTFEKVREGLEPYRDYLMLWYPDSVRWGPIQILIDHHATEIQADSPRWAQVQKGWDQWAIDLPPEVCPRLNGNFKKLFKWRGKGEMPEAEFLRLTSILDSAHAYGRTVRFYAATNKPVVWRTILDAGGDWINADRCERYEAFIRAYLKEQD